MGKWEFTAEKQIKNHYEEASEVRGSLAIKTYQELC
jgi:hypothetical protein